MLTLEKISVKSIFGILLGLVWFIGLGVLMFAPIPKKPVQLDLPITISNQQYWMHTSDDRFAGGPAYIVHENVTADFVHSASNKSALCKFEHSEKNLIAAGLMGIHSIVLLFT